MLWISNKIEQATCIILELKQQLCKLVIILNSEKWNKYISSVLITLNNFVITSNIQFLHSIKHSFENLVVHKNKL